MNYFSEFVDHFAETAIILYKVLEGSRFKKKRRHGQRLRIPQWTARWGEDQRKAWQELKDVPSNPSILAGPVIGAEKQVMTDASAYGLGGVLLQLNTNGKWQPVAFTNRKLKKAERNYAPTERECLAVVHYLSKWRHYLHGEHFTAVTDHLSLRWLLSLKYPREKLARWVVEIQDFDFTVEHRSGPELVVPDALSRNAVQNPLFQRCYSPLGQEVIDEKDGTAGLEQVSALVEVSWCGVGITGGGPSEEEMRIAQVVQFGNVQDFVDGRRDYLVDDEGLLRSTKRKELPMIVPKAMVNEVLRFIHGSRTAGHYKLQRSMASLVRRFWWKYGQGYG